MKPKWLCREVLPLPYFTLCLSRKEFHTELKMLGVDKREWPTFIKTPRADATTSYVRNRDGDLCAIVCLREREGEGITPIAIAALLVHEAVHIWQAHIAQFGGDDAGEFEAYNIQTISQRLMYEYTRRNANH